MDRMFKLQMMPLRPSWTTEGIGQASQCNAAGCGIANDEHEENQTQTAGDGSGPAGLAAVDDGIKGKLLHIGCGGSDDGATHGGRAGQGVVFGLVKKFHRAD